MSGREFNVDGIKGANVGVAKTDSIEIENNHAENLLRSSGLLAGVVGELESLLSAMTGVESPPETENSFISLSLIDALNDIPKKMDSNCAECSRLISEIRDRLKLY